MDKIYEQSLAMERLEINKEKIRKMEKRIKELLSENKELEGGENDQLPKHDPIFYKMALIGLIEEAKANGVNVHISYDTVVFDDENEGIVTTVCSVPVKLAKIGDFR